LLWCCVLGVMSQLSIFMGVNWDQCPRAGGCRACHPQRPTLPAAFVAPVGDMLGAWWGSRKATRAKALVVRSLLRKLAHWDEPACTSDQTACASSFHSLTGSSINFPPRASNS